MVIVRFGVVLGAALYAVFGLLDPTMLPDSHRMAWIIRFGIVLPALALVLAASFHPRFQSRFRPAVMATALVLGAGILAMIALSGPDEPGHRDYYSGLLLVVLWIGTFSQLGFADALVCVGAIAGGYGGVVLLEATPPPGIAAADVPVLIGHGFFLAGASILSVFSAFSFERLKRRRFQQQRELALEKQKTQALLDRIETLFGQQVSSQVASVLAREGGELQSKLCEATVLFLDIRDFTTFADSRPPAEVASFQNAVFAEIIEATRTGGGVINQILGDGVMATFGAPVPRATHARDAVRTSHDILGRIEALGRSGIIPPIRIGIGIHTGQVLAGNIGNEFRKQYSLTGTTVNVAARIEALTKAHGSRLLVSEAVWDALPPEERRGEDLGEIHLRGIGNPLRIHRLA